MSADHLPGRHASAPSSWRSWPSSVVAVWAPLSARLTGEEVVLRVEPVDPVDPFRGAYVDLSYPDLPDQRRRAGPQTEEEQEALDDGARHGIRAADPQGEVWVGGAGAAHAARPRVSTSPATTRAGG